MNLHDCLCDMRRLVDRIGRPVRFMEVCGTHTVSGFRSGLRSVLPPGVRLISGPGCPVCVTPVRYLDWVLALARRQPDILLTTFGDMMRVPGSAGTLEQVKAEGSSVRVVYSPQDALDVARQYPNRQVVFLGVGFETTAPTVAWTIREAAVRRVRNFRVACAHKTIPEAMAALLARGAHLDGYLCPGHVSVIIGSDAYVPLSRTYHVPCVVSGFEPADMAEAVLLLLRQVAEGRAEVEVQYRRSVTPQGNPAAQAICREVFEPCRTLWRGLGWIPESGYRIREAFGEHDARGLLPEPEEAEAAKDPAGCRCGEVLTGRIDPEACGLFGRLCTPERPVGPCMVSSEGTCAAHYKYGGRGEQQ